MSATPILPEICSTLRIARDSNVARDEFRRRRLGDPLRDYSAEFPSAEAAAKAVISALDALIGAPANRALMSRLVGSKVEYSTLRSLAATPISSDDLNTLLKQKINKTSLKSNQQLADDLATLLRENLDPARFPWVTQNRAATPEELRAASLATAVLTAVSAVQAKRRGDERKQLEGRVEQILEAQNFKLVKTPSRGISSRGDFPALAQYMKHCKLGEHNADFVVGLKDGRILAIECKASNSEVNGFKRLNKEVVGDAKDWIDGYGKKTMIVGAALRGVFSSENLAKAQNQMVYLFWWHRMRALEKFLREAV
jgi:hypothetical protein